MGNGEETSTLEIRTKSRFSENLEPSSSLRPLIDTYHEDLIKRSFRECLGDICCYGTVKHNDLGSEMGAEKRDERKMFGC
ncbi:hypothetical protein Tco_0087313 [Tanacetum coccineum]